jgi:hypothetical protein
MTFFATFAAIAQTNFQIQVELQVGGAMASAGGAGLSGTPSKDV